MSDKEGYSADIERALKYIALNTPRPLTLEEVADHCNLSATYFSRKFKLITGQTFKEHLNYIRLRQAKQMLCTTDNTVTKIAMLCGFGSSNYFKDVFKADVGISPREYRKKSGLTRPPSPAHRLIQKKSGSTPAGALPFFVHFTRTARIYQKCG